MISRNVVASTVSLATVSPSDIPTATLPAVASPATVVSTVLDCVALASRSPPITSVPPVPITAVVSLFDIEIPMAGVIAISPLDPPTTSVTMPWLPLAESVRSFAVFKAALFSIAARLSLSAIFNAIEAPTPTPSDPLVASAFALAVLDVVLAAVKDTSPLPVILTVDGLINASLLVFTMFNASDPATPTSPPAAPEVASAPNVPVLSPDTSVITASSDNPLAVTITPVPIEASLVTFATFNATAAPMPIEFVPVAEPSASAAASALLDALNVRAPPAFIVTLSPIEARVSESVMLTPMAAATLTAPSAVDASGVAAAPEPVAPWEPAVLSPNVR